MSRITVNERTFEIVKSSTKQADAIRWTLRGWYKDFEDLYERPSETKREIYKDWRDWFTEVDGFIEGCTGNSMTFSIYGYINIDGQMCPVQITKEHNRIVM